MADEESERIIAENQRRYKEADDKRAAELAAITTAEQHIANAIKFKHYTSDGCCGSMYGGEYSWRSALEMTKAIVCAIRENKEQA
jgi:hypothetical protein